MVWQPDQEAYQRRHLHEAITDWIPIAQAVSGTSADSGTATPADTDADAAEALISCFSSLAFLCACRFTILEQLFCVLVLFFWSHTLMLLFQYLAIMCVEQLIADRKKKEQTSVASFLKMSTVD